MGKPFAADGCPIHDALSIPTHRRYRDLGFHQGICGFLKLHLHHEK